MLNAHAHRFRHTLATEVLTTGGTEQDVCGYAGNQSGNRPQALRQMDTAASGANRDATKGRARRDDFQRV